MDANEYHGMKPPPRRHRPLVLPTSEARYPMPCCGDPGDCGRDCVHRSPPVEARKYRVDPRTKFLEEVAGAVGKRAATYGTPEDNFARIARHWTVFFKNRFDVDLPLTSEDVALLMDLMKTSRLENDIHHHDSWVDKAGYAACGAGIEEAGKENAGGE